MFIKLWKDPVWSKVIATIILGISGLIYTYASNILAIFQQYCKHTWNFFLDTSNWLLTILIISMLFLIYLLYAILVATIKARKSIPNWHNYTKDTIFGLSWQWSYSNEKIKNLNCFCPECNYEIIPKDVTAYAINPRFEYSCDDCGYCTDKVDSLPGDLLERVTLKIQKNIRNNWIK